MTDSKEKYIPMSGTLKFTSDYSIFIKAKGNRKVYPTQVAKLLLKIKARGQKVPVIVNENNQIIDGQHRVEVCEKLGIPVMYLVCKNASLEDIKDINNSAKLWNFEDYLRCYSRNGYKKQRTYLTLRSFKERYDLPGRIALYLLSGNSHDLGLNDFRTGNFEIDNIKEAHTFGDCLKKIRKTHKCGRSVRFARALVNNVSIHNSDLNLDRLVKQIEKYPQKIKGPNVQEFEDSILNCYSYQKRGRKLSNRKTVGKK